MSAPRPVRPRRLSPGDTVAIVTPSWGGPGAFPHVADHGIGVLRSWGLVVREMPFARADPAAVRRDPQRRADDVNAAFADSTIAAVITSIGGDDSIRLLPLLDRDVIAANPKILMGYSDTTTLLLALRRLGMVTFHGPSLMAGISQMRDLAPAYEAHVRSMLMDQRDAHEYLAYGTYVEGYRDWRDPSNVGLANAPLSADPPRALQGSGVVAGELFGGCIEVLDWLRGTWAWPADDEWSGRLLFLEPSEEKPSPLHVERILRSMGPQGVFERITGILLGRPRDHSPDEARVFEEAVVSVVAGELGRPDLPIVAGLPFGHTDPQWVLPIGVRAELDVDATTLRLTEPWLR